MNDFWKQITDTNWWISVFFVGIAINLISNIIPKYWKYALDSYSKFRTTSKQEFEKLMKIKGLKQEELIKQVKQNPEILSYYKWKISYYQNRLIMFFTFIIIFAIFGGLDVFSFAGIPYRLDDSSIIYTLILMLFTLITLVILGLCVFILNKINDLTRTIDGIYKEMTDKFDMKEFKDIF